MVTFIFQAAKFSDWFATVVVVAGAASVPAVVENVIAKHVNIMTNRIFTNLEYAFNMKKYSFG